MDISYKEKSAWISLVSTVLIFGYYLISLTGLSDLPPEEGKTQALWLLGQTLLLTVIVEAVFHAMLAASNRRDAELDGDERDQWIALKANQAGYRVLVTVIWVVLGRMVILEFNPQFADENSSIYVPMLTVHLLMFGFIFSEVVRFGSQIWQYRREAFGD
ncbi:hypothetical protein LJ739_11515 [Aestuariibacter halophilus]|uniref:DUF2975 domain-containing protein n=1 Tax=Fluctibacter halophilus TaxID=226011 RepID=A0ABS8G9K8_9ALTE|nr:hypothetical protein [Aestuariibacter halophilus]MCC2616871.1 hypothetical protein [Aestuariibacter halophilus]